MRTYQKVFEQKTTTCGNFTVNEIVVVKIFENQKQIETRSFGVVDINEIYSKIEQNQPIDLSSCYVKNFAIKSFKSKYNLSENEPTKLIKFTANNAFFEADVATDFTKAVFVEGADFSNTLFLNGSVSFVSSKFEEGLVNFKEVFFDNESVSFQYTKFGQGNVDFSNANFNVNQASFVNSNFSNGSVSFKNVNFFEARVNFHFAKFGNGDKTFENANFGNQFCDFRKIEFGTGKIDFRKTIFGNGEVNFDESEITSGKLNFRWAVFGNSTKSFKHVDFGKDDALFENVDFGSGIVDFSNSKATKITFEKSHLNVFLNLKFQEAEEINLSNTIIRDIVDLQPSDNAVNIKTLHLVGARNLGRIIIDWKQNHVKNAIKNQLKTSLIQKAEQFNILKENFRSNGQYEDEDLAYIQFKRFEHRAELERVFALGGKKYLKLPYLFFKWVVFDKMGLYATNPLRVLFSMFIIYFLFSLTYYIIGISGGGDIINAVGATDNLSFLQSCFYHSAITFLTIGYGDYYPSGFERVISITEGWCGVFLMSYFTVAFVRKILR
jgi:hypothetical protein